jgi:hypothetical protein
MPDIIHIAQPILDLLGVDAHSVKNWIVIWFSLQMLAKLFAGWLQRKLTSAVERAIESKDREDDLFFVWLLGTRGYRICAFVLDWLARIKLPRREDIPSMS